MGTITKIGLAVILALSILCAAFFFLWRNAEGDRQRLQKNQNSLLEEVDYYQTEANHNAASVAALTLSMKEIKEYNKDLVKTCDELNISLRRMVSASVSGLESNYHVSGRLIDTPVIKENPDSSKVIDTARCMNYFDPHLSFSCCVDSSDIVIADIETRDTIKSVLHKVPRKFLFIKFGVKEIRQEVFSTNPHTHIVYSEIIENKRNKR